MASQYKHAVLKYATFAHLRQQSLYELDFKSIDILKAWFMKVETALCGMLAQLHNQCFTFFYHPSSLYHPSRFSIKVVVQLNFLK